MEHADNINGVFWQARRASWNFACLIPTYTLRAVRYHDLPGAWHPKCPQGVKIRISPDREKSPNEDVSGDDIYMTR